MMQFFPYHITPWWLLAAGIISCPVRAVAETRTVGEVLHYIGQKAGVTALADSTLLRVRVAMPPADATVTAGNVEQYIRGIVKALPEGATWAKLYLPPPPPGKEWTGDEVVAYGLAQSKLFGVVGIPRDDGTVEVLSQRLAKEKARYVIAALNLKPVYVVTLGRGGFSGVWNTTFGEMHLKQSGRRITGTYTYEQGEIDGIVSGDTLKFRWVEHGTGSRGTGVFTLAANGDSFKGVWTYDDRDSSPSEWTGERVSRN